MSKQPKHKSQRSHHLQRSHLLRHVQLRTTALVFALIIGIIGASIILMSRAAQYGGGGGGDDSPIDQTNLPAKSPNPQINRASCSGGLDIAFVADVSGSVYGRDGTSVEFTEMQTAIQDFVSALLPSTNTMISLTQFDDSAKIVQPFTNNVASLYSGVNSLTGGGETDWTIGLQVGYSTITSLPKSNTPKLLIIATDGNPNQPTDKITALTNAMNRANAIKAAGVHILALGLGKSPRVENLEDITGTKLNTPDINSDVITTDFASLNSVLINLAANSCGTGGSGSGSGGTGTGTGGTGTGSGGTGTGTGGTGTGTGGTGNGNGGTGTGTGGTGTGTGGGGTGTSGTGSGSGNPVPTKAPSPFSGPAPTVVPYKAPITITQVVQNPEPNSTPVPTIDPNPQPTPTPTAQPSPQPTPQPTPSPTPKPQGVTIKPPEQQPSVFQDGKLFPAGSTPDDAPPVTQNTNSNAWLYILIAVPLPVSIIGYLFWQKRKLRTKPRSKKSTH